MGKILTTITYLKDNNAMTIKNKVSTLLATGLLLVAPLAVNATVISVYNDNDLVNYDGSNAPTLRGEVDCDSCSVLNFDGSSYSFQTSIGELFAGPGPASSTSAETAWLN